MEADGNHPGGTARSNQILLEAVRRRPRAAPSGHRGVVAVATDGPDVLALGDPGRRVLRHAPSEGSGPPHLSRRGEPRPRAMGAIRTTTTPPGRRKAHSGLRRRPPRLPRAARGPCGNDRRDQRAARPSPQSPTRPRRRATRLSSASTNGGPRPSRSCSARTVGMSEEGPTQHPTLSCWGRSMSGAIRRPNGEVGYIWNGVPTLLLTTTGRRTGEARTTPLIFGRDERGLPGGGLNGRGADAPNLVPEPAGDTRRPRSRCGPITSA